MRFDMRMSLPYDADARSPQSLENQNRGELERVHLASVRARGKQSIAKAGNRNRLGILPSLAGCWQIARNTLELKEVTPMV